MSEITQRTQAAYDQLVEVYAEANHKPLSGSLEALAQRLAQYVGFQGTVLDAGCGTGRDLDWFTDHGVWAAGIDLSVGMLAFARQALERPGAAPPPLAQMDMTRLGFPSGYFSGVWCSAALLHLPKQAAPAALGEFHRLLRPGGMLALSLQQGRGETWEPGYGTSIERFFARYSPEEISGMLESCGFAIQFIDQEQAGTKLWISLACLCEA
jgi:ubiquinone/menaquinone biosynthesis C-methylase UbiE